MATIEKRSKMWTSKHQALKGESKEQYEERVKEIMADTSAVAARTRGRRTPHGGMEEEEEMENEANEEATSHSEEAIKLYEKDVAMEREERRPRKILDHRWRSSNNDEDDTDDEDVPLKNLMEYHLLWADAGYGGQDHEAWKDEEYCKKWPGLVENYRAVRAQNCMNHVM